MKFFQFVHACGLTTYSEVWAANFESGTWIIYDSKLLNLEILKIENDTSNAIRILGNIHPRQPDNPDASMESHTWMNQNKEAVAQLVSTTDTDHVKSESQDKESIPNYQKPRTLSHDPRRVSC